MSHNAMKSFFSGQDDSMLKQEGAKRNHFLSLVVNNAREYVARITCKESYKYTVEGTSTFRTFNDIAAEKVLKEEREQIAVIAYDLKIEYPNVISEYKELDERIEEIKKRKEKEKKENKNTFSTEFESKHPWYYKDTQTSLWETSKSTPTVSVQSTTPTVKEITKQIEEKYKGETSADCILTDEECANYAAQLIKLDMLAQGKDIVSFLPKMEQEIEKRFDSEADYKDVLHLFADEILDYELGGALLDIYPEQDVDIALMNIKLEIASYLEDKTRGKSNKYIELIIEYLYA